MIWETAAGMALRRPFDAAKEWDEFEESFKLSLRRKGKAPAKVQRAAGVRTAFPQSALQGTTVAIHAPTPDGLGRRKLRAVPPVDLGRQAPAITENTSKARQAGAGPGSKPSPAGPIPIEACRALLPAVTPGTDQEDRGGAAEVPFHSGGVTVLRWGVIEPSLRTHSHMGKGYCCPVGFASCRTYISTSKPNQRVWYLSRTSQRDGQLIVEVVEVAGEWKVFTGSTPTEAWQKALLEVNRTTSTRKRVTVSGPQFMGLSNEDIKRQISLLPRWAAWNARRA